MQVCSTESIGSSFGNRQYEGANGIPSNQEPPLQVNWCGKANGKPGYWNWDYQDLGPRIAFAWAPSRTSGLLGALFRGKQNLDSWRIRDGV